MSATGPLRVMLVEDYAAFREVLAILLSHESDLEVVAQAGSLVEAREALEGDLKERLDVAVVDLALPDGDGSELIGELRRRSPGITVMVLSATLWPGRIDELLKAGADAVVDKVQSPAHIADEVRRVGRGG